MKYTMIYLFLFGLIIPACLNGQQLKSGFDKNEYREMLLIGTRTSANEEYYKKYPAPQSFRKIYQSAVVGLDNLWDLWISDNHVAVISTCLLYTSPSPRD